MDVARSAIGYTRVLAVAVVLAGPGAGCGDGAVPTAPARTVCSLPSAPPRAAPAPPPPTPDLPHVAYAEGRGDAEPRARRVHRGCAGSAAAARAPVDYRLRWLWQLETREGASPGTWRPVRLAPAPARLRCGEVVPFGALTGLGATAVGTYWAVAEVDGRFESGLVHAGPVACQDVRLGPAPRGQVALCAFLPGSARAVFALDPSRLALDQCTRRQGGEVCDVARPDAFVARRLARARADLGRLVAIVRLLPGSSTSSEVGVVLVAGPAPDGLKPSLRPIARLGEAGMRALVEHLSEDGFFHRAEDVTPAYHLGPGGPWLEIVVGTHAETVPWGPRQRERLAALAERLGGPTGEALGRLAYRIAPGMSPAPGAR